jgi:hypothetical protein
MKLPLPALWALAWTNTVNGACSSNLLVDNYADHANNLNSLKQWTSGENQLGQPIAIVGPVNS